MTWQAETRSWMVASAAIFCLGTLGYKALMLPDLAPTVRRANDTLDIINKPCKGVSCGTLANVDKLIVKAGDIAVTTQRQVAQSSVIVNAAAQSLTSTSSHLNAAIDTAKAQMEHIGPVLDSLPPAVEHITFAFDPVIANANGAVTDFRGFLSNPALTHSFENVDSVTGSWAGISGDFRKVADKTTEDYLKPVKWYMYPLKRGGEVMDIGSAIARHAP